MSNDMDLDNAKAFLMTAGDSGVNVYDHLTAVIERLLDQKQANAIDSLEDISRQIKSGAFTANSTLQNVTEKTQEVELATAQIKLFKAPDAEADSDEPPVVPNLLESAMHFEDGGIGIGQEETFRVFLALKELSETQPITKIRFWGKLLGLDFNYFVAEAEYREGEEPEVPEAEEEPEPEAPAATEEDEEGVVKEKPIPESEFIPTPPLPAEEYGSGVNKKIYFVCNEPGGEWTLLPNATPAQIVCARKIKKFFTGRLAAPVVTYPPFPGAENSLLRAQIALISADTIVSPLGLYTFDEDEEEPEDGSGRENFIPNEEYEIKPNAELLDPEMTGWCHHMSHILPQGRCRYIKPVVPKKKKEGEEEEEEEEEEEDDGVEAETGPPLLSPLQNDPEVGGRVAWTAKTASVMKGAFSSVIISSNKWPGAHAFAAGKLFENIYIGWGHPYSAQAYNPSMPPQPQSEWAPEIKDGEPDDEENAGASLRESVEPTRAQEAEYEAMLAEKAAAEAAAQADEEEQNDGGDDDGDED